MDAFESAGHSVIAAPAVDAPDALTKAFENYRGEVDAVAIAGGDGTLFFAAAAIRALGVPLLVVPLGTINELARTLEIPLDIAPACALIDTGRTHSIDLGVVNGRYFFNEASMGLSTHVARAQNEQLKSVWGMLAIPVATLRSLGWMRPHHFDVETERGPRAFSTVQLTVANSNRFGGIVENADASLEDGRLDLYSVDVRDWHDVAAIALAIVRRHFPEAHCVTDLRGTRFVVRSHSRHAVFADGEPASFTPAEFTIAPRAVEVYVPAPVAQKSE